MSEDTEAFEACRAELLALAYRMLGDMGRAEDAVQETWLRWRSRGVAVEVPKAYLLKVVTNLCLNELASARARREESRGDRLPEPVDLGDGRLGPAEMLDELSMAFLVMLQRLTPAERAVLILHDVFDYSHGEIADLVSKSEAACRQLLRRARDNVAAERRTQAPSAEEHRRLLRAFVDASGRGDVDALVSLLAEDAVLIADAGPKGATFGGARNLGAPLSGAAKVAAFSAAVTPRGAEGLSVEECWLNGEPAMLVTREGVPFAAILIAVADGKIARVFIQADPERLGHVRVVH